MSNVSGVSRKRRATAKGDKASLISLRAQGRQQSKAMLWTDALESWRRLAEIEPDDFESLYRQAQSLFFLGQIDSAAQLARQAWSLAPNDDRPGVILARALHRTQLWAEAAQSWQRLLKLNPKNFEAALRLSQSLAALGHLSLARTVAEYALLIKPGNSEALNVLERAQGERGGDGLSGMTESLAMLLSQAREYSRQRRWPEAQEAWYQYTTRSPKDFEGFYRLAQSLYEQGQHPQAIAVSRRAAVINPDNASNQTMLGQLLLKAKDWIGAEACFWAVLARIPDDFEAAYGLGHALFEQGRLSEAKKWLDRAHKQRVNHGEVLVLLGRLKLRAKRSALPVKDEAGVSTTLAASVSETQPSAQAYTTVSAGTARLAASNPKAASALVQALMDQGALIEARAKATLFLGIWPDHEGLLVLQSRIRRRLASQVEAKPTSKKFTIIDTSIQEGRDAISRHDWHAAVDIWGNVVARDPNYFEGWYRLAQAHLELGLLQDVIRYSEKARDIRPKHLSNLTVLARAHQRLGSTEASVACWQTILELSPQNYEATYRLGQCLETLKKPEEAERQFAAAQALKPDAIDALLFRVGSLVKLGRFDGAVECWQEFIDRRPQDIFARKRFAAFLRTHKSNADAEVVLRDILRQRPNDQEAAYLLATIMLDAKRWNEVIELLEPIALSVSDESATLTSGILQHYARALDGVGRLADAELEYRKALKHEPENITTLTRLGRVLRELGRPEEAVEIRRLVCEVSPQDPGNWQELIFLLASLERESEARKALSLAETVLPESPANFARLGRICESALFFDDARRYFHLAIEQDPSMAKHAGFFCARQGALDDALRYLNQARDVEPSSVDTAKALIEQLQICEMFGVSQDWILNQPHDRELLLSELLYESMAEGLLDRAQLYEPVKDRVILITGSLAAGGAERQLVTTIRGLAKRIPEVESVTLLVSSLSKRSKKDFYLNYISDLPVEIVVLDVPEQLPAPRKIVDVNSRLIDAFPDDQREAIRVYYQEFVARRPEVIHAWQDSTCLNAVVAAALAGVPRILLSTRSTRPDNPRRRLKRYMQRGYIASMRLPNVVMLNNSQAGANDYEDWLSLPAGTVKVIYNGLDFDVLRHAADMTETNKNRDRYKIPKNAPVIGGVFRMSEEKRPLLWVETAAEIAREIPNAHFVVAGDGPMRFDMQERARELGIADRFHMPGHVSVPSWFLLMDIVLLTSRMEGLPNVLLEAQSFGIPVIAPDVGGCAETIEQGVTGWAVKDATASSLAEKIIFMLQDKAWMEKARVAAADHARQKFSVEAMVGKTLEIYGVGPDANWPGLPMVSTRSVDALRGAALDAGAGNPERAKRLWLQLIEQSPDDTDANLSLGKIYFAEADHARAADHFKWVVAVERCHIECWRWLARSQSGLKEFDDALTSWRKLLALAPDDFEALYRAGELLYQKNKMPLARRLLEKARVLNPAHQATARVLARLLQSQGDLSLAFETWVSLIDLSPNDFEAHFRAGQVGLTIDKVEQGQRLLINACALAPRDFKPFNALARSLIWSGQLREVQRLLLWHLKQNPHCDEAIEMLGALLTIRGRDRTIQRTLQRSARKVAKAAKDLQAALTYARLLSACGRYDDAEELLTAFERRNGKHCAEVRELQSHLAIRNGRFENAVRWIDTEASPSVKAAVRDYNDFAAVVGPFLKNESLRDAFLRVLRQHLDTRGDCPFNYVEGSVLHVVNSLAAGGTERQSAIVAVAQQNSGEYSRQVTLLRTDPASQGRGAFFLPYLAEHNLPTVTLSEVVAGAGDDVYVDSLLSLPKGAVAARLGSAEMARLYLAIQTIKPNILHAWTPQTAAYCAIAGLLAGVPRILLRVGSVAPDRRPFITPTEKEQFHWYRDILNYALRSKSVVLVSNCEANVNGWILWIGLKRNELGNKPVVVHNAIDVAALGDATQLEVNQLCSSLQISPRARVIGAVMRLEPEKGLDLWLDCAQQLHLDDPDLVFVVVGDGRLREDFAAGVARRGLSQCVRIVGSVSERLAAYYRLINVLLVTSHIEGLPNAMIEAQWFGTPVVAVDVGGVREAGIGEFARVVPRDSGAVIAAVRTCLKDRRRGDLKAIRAELSSKFSTDEAIKSLLSAYR